MYFENIFEFGSTAVFQDSNNERLEKLAKQYSTMFDLCGPMKGCATPQGRHLFMEGDLKYKDNVNKVSNAPRKAKLFSPPNPFILSRRYSAHGLRALRPPRRVIRNARADRMEATEPTNLLPSSFRFVSHYCHIFHTKRAI